jgi:hypothetical protein
MNRPSTPAGAIPALLLAAILHVTCASPRDVPVPAPGEGPGTTDARPTVASDGPAGAGLDAEPGDGPAAPDPGTMDPPPCGPDQQACPGLGCVDIKSPEHCGRSCAPCPSIAGGAATCDGARCGVSCPMGMQPCLDKCIAEGAACDDVCPPMQRACNGVCVDLTNLAACGPACMPCPTSPRGKATCNGTSCELTCDPGYHRCEDDTCRSDRDVKSCGSSCTPCPVPEGGEATCDGTMCGNRCPAGTTLCTGKCIPVGQACNGVCPEGKHDCGGNCVPNDVNFCGPTCKQCRPPANADARCNGNDCTFTCRTNHRECNGGCLANDRPCNGACPNGSKVCGDTCVPTSTCCTDNREGCPACNSCGGNGVCNRRPDNTSCGGSQVCRGGACVACGTQGLICCGDTCASGLICRGGSCASCGGNGEPCCGNNACDGAGLTCRGGTCAACGAFGQPCCGNNACGGGLSCQDGTCRGECTPMQRECRGQVPRTCNGNGQWVEGTRCSGQACVNGACTGTCEPMDRRCGPNETPQTCNNNGQYANSGMPCAGVCIGQGQCSGNCRGGNPTCDDAVRVECQNNNLVRTTCPAPPQNGRAGCTGNGICRPTCNMGFAPCNGDTACCCSGPPRCENPTTRVACNGNQIERTPCPDPENGRAVCSGGTCSVECDQGFTRQGDQCVCDGALCGATCVPRGTCNALVRADPDQCRAYNACTRNQDPGVCDFGRFSRAAVDGDSFGALRSACESRFAALGRDACSRRPPQARNEVEFYVELYNGDGSSAGSEFVRAQPCP